MSKRRVRKRKVDSLRRLLRRDPEQQRQIDELRRSNAAGVITPKPDRGTRGAKERRAIEDQYE